MENCIYSPSTKDSHSGWTNGLSANLGDSSISRIFEKVIVKQFLYPALLDPLIELSFEDQFAFRPAGSCTVAIIALLHTVSTMLRENPYVIVIALDFSKVFDTVRHAALAKKLPILDMPDSVYNWMIDFLVQHEHCTVF